VCGELVEYDGELLEARVIRDMPLAWVFSVRQKILFYRYRPGWHGVCLKIIVGEKPAWVYSVCRVLKFSGVPGKTV
jgi:hypothetical protein